MKLAILTTYFLGSSIYYGAFVPPLIDMVPFFLQYCSLSSLSFLCSSRGTTGLLDVVQAQLQPGSQAKFYTSHRDISSIFPFVPYLVPHFLGEG